MKKVILFVSMLCCTLSGFAEAKPIKLEIKDLPNERSLVQSPTASIDGQVLIVSFTSSTDFDIAVVDATGIVVYTSIFHAQGTTITLPDLPTGDYELVIEDTTHTYSGEFDIE